MNREVKKLWLKALRSGEYKQGQSRLEDDGELCCLGVLCKIASDFCIARRKILNHTILYDNREGFLPASVVRWSGVESENPAVGALNRVGNYATQSLSLLNDTGATFLEIADVIEEQL